MMMRCIKKFFRKIILYSQEIARHLTTSKQNKSSLDKSILESATTEILELQFAELNNLTLQEV
jgi:transcriptional regulator